jgi:hypothetical protein
MENPNKTLKEILKPPGVVITETDWQTVNDAHKTTADAISIISQRIIQLEEAFNALQKMVLSGAIMYRPEGEENYLNMKENFDLIYSKLKECKNGLPN